MEQKYRCEKRLLTLTFFFNILSDRFYVHISFFYKIATDRSQLIGPTCRLQIREQGVSRLFFEHCDWMVISATSDIVSNANDTHKRDRERSNTCNRLQLFRVSQNKQTNKDKKTKEKRTIRQDPKQVRVELLRRSDLIGNGHTGQRPWPSTQRTSNVKSKNRIEM